VREGRGRTQRCTIASCEGHPSCCCLLMQCLARRRCGTSRKYHISC
jgi:hypothetical protein